MQMFLGENVSGENVSGENVSGENVSLYPHNILYIHYKTVFSHIPDLVCQIFSNLQSEVETR